MSSFQVAYSYISSFLTQSRIGAYRDDVSKNIDQYLPSDVYNLFIIASIIALFFWIFRIALRERHIKELTSHLMSNNSLIFDMLGTDVDILRQFTPEHLMKYLEYNSGCEPLPIEQIVCPFILNRESMTIVNRDTRSILQFKVDALQKFSIELFWSVPSSIYKKCCKDLAKLICVKDPTFRRSFLNPFLTTKDSIANPAISDVLSALQENAKNGCSSKECFIASSSLEYSIPEIVFQELSSYHLDGNSLSIFSEASAKKVSLRPVNSYTNLLRLQNRASNPIFTSLPSSDIHMITNRSSQRGESSTTHASDIIPLIVVLWSTEEGPDEAMETETGKTSSGIHKLAEYLSSPSSQLSTIIKQKTNETNEEKKRLFVRHSERTDDGKRGTSSIIDEKKSKELKEPREPREPRPQFAQIVVVHFLRNRVPTIIRRINICPDGVYIPRSVYQTSEVDNQKNDECIICFSNPNDVILLPCRHKLVCRYCVCMIKQCPLCRATISYYLVEGEEERNSQQAEAIMS